MRPRRNRLDVAVSCLFFFFLLHEKKASSWTIADASCITHGFDCFPRQSQRLFDALTEVTRGRNIRFVGVVAARPHRTLKRLYIQTRSCDNPHPHPARIAHAAETPPADNGKEAEQETRRKRHPYINTYIYSDTPTSTPIYTYLHLSIGQANERGGVGEEVDSSTSTHSGALHPFRSCTLAHFHAQESLALCCPPACPHPHPHHVPVAPDGLQQQQVGVRPPAGLLRRRAAQRRARHDGRDPLETRAHAASIGSQCAEQRDERPVVHVPQERLQLVALAH